MMSLKMQSVAFISVQVSLDVIQGFAGTICCPQMAGIRFLSLMLINPCSLTTQVCCTHITLKFIKTWINQNLVNDGFC